MAFVRTFNEKAIVTELMPAQRIVALRSKAGLTTRCKVAPQVGELNQVRVGDKVKATLTDAALVFLLKRGSPPPVGAGLALPTGPPGTETASMVLETTDYRATVTKVDRAFS